MHTDTPEVVFSYAARWGRVDATKAEDMRMQHRRLAHRDRRAVAIVTDSSADLPDSVLDRHRIALVPLQVTFGSSTFRDQPRDCFVTLATGVLGTHVGPGAWGIFYQVEDGPADPFASLRAGPFASLRAGPLDHGGSPHG